MITHFLKKLDELNLHEPHKYAQALRHASTPYEKLSVITDAGGASRGKELRDHNNDEAHRICNEISKLQIEINKSLYVQIQAESKKQIQEWKEAIFANSIKQMDEQLKEELEREELRGEQEKKQQPKKQQAKKQESGPKDELTELLDSLLQETDDLTTKGPTVLEMQEYYRTTDAARRVSLKNAIEGLFADGNLSFHAIHAVLSSDENKHFMEVGFWILDHEESYLFAKTLIELSPRQFSEAQAKITAKIKEFES